MTAQTIVFLVLLANQLAATATFVVMYRRTDWRHTAVGRHLAYWVTSAAALDLTWALIAVARQPWLIYVLFAAQAVVGVVGWQRVWLVWKAQHRDE